MKRTLTKSRKIIKKEGVYAYIIIYTYNKESELQQFLLRIIYFSLRVAPYVPWDHPNPIDLDASLSLMAFS